MLPLFFGKNGYELMYDFKWSNKEDIIRNRKELYSNLNDIVEEQNKKMNNLYNKEQLTIIKKLMSKLINPNAYKRSNSETIARSLYNQLNCNFQNNSIICSIALLIYSYNIFIFGNILQINFKFKICSDKEYDNSSQIDIKEDSTKDIID